MAIVFTKEPSGDILNAYNNCVLEFNSNSLTIASRALITVSGYTFEITPNKGVFYFNLKEIVKVLINQNAFADTIEVDAANNYLFSDPSLYLEITATIKLISSNGFSETTTKDFKFLKSAQQLYRDYYKESELIRVLLPYNEGRKHVTYFEGLPFDVPIYSNESRTIQLRHNRTGLSVALNLVKGVNRLFISNGENDRIGFEKWMPLFVGLNDLEIIIDSETKILLPVKKVAVDCGEYLKWFNQQGGWSYWRFDKVYKESVSSRKKDEINTDFYNLNESKAPSISTGKDTTRTLNLLTGNMDRYERALVSGIFESPKVFIYTNRELQIFNQFDWKDVDISSSGGEVLNTKNDFHNFKVNVELPKQYNQTYAN